MDVVWKSCIASWTAVDKNAETRRLMSNRLNGYVILQQIRDYQQVPWRPMTTTGCNCKITIKLDSQEAGFRPSATVVSIRRISCISSWNTKITSSSSLASKCCYDCLAIAAHLKFNASLSHLRITRDDLWHVGMLNLHRRLCGQIERWFKCGVTPGD